MSVDRERKPYGKRRRKWPGAARLLRRLRLVLALALVLTTFQHLTGTHVTAAHAHAPATAEVTATVAAEAAEPPCDREQHHAAGACHAADSCPIFSTPGADMPALAAAATPAMPDAFATGRSLTPLRHPPKRSLKA